MRLVTRMDFDGLVCAVLLTEVGLIDDIAFIHPKDLQDGKIEVSEDDVIANLPYARGCGMWFDHHSSEEERLTHGDNASFTGASYVAPSCARVIFEYYGGEKRFAHIAQNGLIASVDKNDSANLTIDEIEHPQGWLLLAFLVDPRTGLGRYRDFRISCTRLIEDLIHYCRTMPADEILRIPDVRERVERYYEQEEDYREMIAANSDIQENVLIINLLCVDEVFSGNRFAEYVMFPGQNVSIRILWGKNRQNVVFACGKSITNKSADVDIGSLMLQHGGGGHRDVGTCQVPVNVWENKLAQIVAALQKGQDKKIRA